MDTLYEVRSVDMFGNQPQTHPNVSSPSPARLELNAEGSWTFEVPVDDPFIDYLRPIAREVQLWRQGRLVWWGVIVKRLQPEGSSTWQIICSGLLWYFKKRVVGKAERTNYLVNGSFDAGNFYGWNTAGLTVDIVTDWGGRPGQTFQANLYQGGSGNDSFIRQQVLVPGGAYWTLSADFHIRTDAQWAGAAVDGRGLYVERHHPVTYELEDVRFFVIDDSTTRGQTIEAITGIDTPPGRDSVLDIRLYATLCMNPTPDAGHPPGGIIWDNAKLVAMESLSYTRTDVGAVLNGLVAHAQDPAYGKGSLNIGAACPGIGAGVDRYYQHVDRTPIDQAVQEFVDLGFVDVDVVFSQDGKTRNFTCWPKRGSVRGTYELGAADGIRTLRQIEEDGDKVVTTPIIQGSGSGPSRNEASASDTSGTGGVVIEQVFQALDGTHFDQLQGIANAKSAQLHAVPKIPTVTIPGDRFHEVGLGDTIRLLIDVLGPEDIAAYYRIVAIQLDPAEDQVTLELNAA